MLGLVGASPKGGICEAGPTRFATQTGAACHQDQDQQQQTPSRGHGKDEADGPQGVPVNRSEAEVLVLPEPRSLFLKNTTHYCFTAPQSGDCGPLMGCCRRV